MVCVSATPSCNRGFSRGEQKFVQKPKAPIPISNTVHSTHYFFQSSLCGRGSKRSCFEGVNLALLHSRDPPAVLGAPCVPGCDCAPCPHRVWHHDRRLHHLHQRLHVYSQLPAHQPSHHLRPSHPSRILKHYWGRSINCHFLITKLTFSYVFISK